MKCWQPSNMACKSPLRAKKKDDLNHHLTFFFNRAGGQRASMLP